MDERARKIAATMKARGLDNFKHWREEAKRNGFIKSGYPLLKKDGNLAELIGTILGDGHIGKHPRCDCLRIVGDFKKIDFVNRAAWLVETVFDKRPTIRRVTGSNAVTITVYEKRISERLGIPHGSRAELEYLLPPWISRSRTLLIRFIRGLYEAEGSLCFHPPTYTHKFLFANTNPHLLKLVADSVERLGFHPHRSPRQVQVSRKQEVQDLKNLLKFRSY